jgi:Membrane bound O-acyl transferase family
MVTSLQPARWASMWFLALLLYACAKAVTLVMAHVGQVPLTRKLCYFFLFPGMNPAGFCGRPRTQPFSSTALPRYATNIFVGVALLWGLARHVPPAHPLIQGWIGMIGLVLLLHFGFLQLISLFWQSAGFDAPLLMNQPVWSISLTDFWSHRWNTAFRQLSHQFIFRPLARRTSPRIALLLTFVASGAVHDLVISVPAGAGFGLPTAYFLLQALGVQFERTRMGKAMLRPGIAARSFAFAVIALPAPLLFHPPFVTRVFLPFMVAIGALPKAVL